MKVILNGDVETLGEVGDVVEVKPGFARNYLFPRELALEVNKHNLEVMKARKKKIKIKLELEKLSAQEQKQKLEELTLEIQKKAGEKGVLFGSVTVTEIESKLEEMGVKIERKKFHLDEPIKRLGNHTCKIRLFKDVEAELKIVVTSEDGEEEPSVEDIKEETKEEEVKEEEIQNEEPKKEADSSESE